MDENEDSSPKGGSCLVTLIRWGFRLSIVAIAAYFLFGDFFEKREEKFITQSISAARANCNNDEACLTNVDANGESCVLSHYHMERASKRAKRYVLDEEDFYACLDSFK